MFDVNAPGDYPDAGPLPLLPPLGELDFKVVLDSLLFQLRPYFFS